MKKYIKIYMDYHNYDISDWIGCEACGTTAVDISGMTLAGQIRKSYDSTSATATFTTALVTAASGIYRLKLTNSETAAITAGRYVFDVELTLNDSTIERVHGGIATITPEVTK